MNTDITEADAIDSLPAVGECPPAHYDAERKTFWTQNDRGGWIDVNEQILRRLLHAAGIRGGRPNKDDKGLTPLDHKLNDIVTRQDVGYAGPLAGYRSGLTEMCGQRILVTTSPKLITPVAGEWRVLGRFLDSLLYDAHYNQTDYVRAWLKLGYEALRDGTWRGAPAMALAGPRDCGKSLLQNLFTEILGGRAAKPYRYMSGGTQFNRDLFGAEHLTIEDDHSSTDIRARRAFGSNIKQFTANRDQSCHGKGRQAITLRPFWRVSISVNDEPEAMMVLPPLSDSVTDSIGDKIILLKAQKADIPCAAGNDEWQAFWHGLMAELPAFIDSLVKWQIPGELQDRRFGVKAWQHPDLLTALDALAPETRLLALIDEVIFTGFHCDPVKTARGVKLGWLSKWEGTAEDLERRLCNDEGFGHEARRLLGHWQAATGTYLGRLAQKHPDRVVKLTVIRGKQRWVIHREAKPATATGACLPDIAA